MSLSIDDFAAFHSAVHRSRPFPWQCRLLREVVSGHRWPRVLDLPTGCGKTTCLDIALFALALDAQRPPASQWCPRRIAMVVDRRILVDQVAERGRKLARALTAGDAPAIVREVSQALRSLSHAEEPVGVFTLRGGMPKDDGWARSPDQPLILASTVDQLGSRLFMQGYGVSPGMKPVHAGLLGNDTLVLLDEVHLSRPFAQTLDRLAALRAGLRERQARTDGAAVGLPVRFAHAFLSATPGESGADTFRLTDEEREIGAALGPRLHAKKPARMLEVRDREELEKRCLQEAADLVSDHGVVGVVVNRVASALAIAEGLRQRLGGDVDVVLLTGRMRPLDRDDVLRGVRPRIMTGRERREGDRKIVVVGTQCIEAGADFDFDALVTESASIDALRQRFGRVDRLGSYGRAAGVIVHDKSPKRDPVYGDSIVETMKWLKEGASGKQKAVDLGSLALPAPPASALAPRACAPVLLPTYLDLWSQTSPEPAVLPDLGLFLHGPDGGPPDVQIVWRLDLHEADLNDTETACAIVGAVRPSALEAVSVPFISAKRWLGHRPGRDVLDVGDVERQSDAGDETPGDRRALRWAGANSRVISAADLRPGDTIVVPAERGGLCHHCFVPDATETVLDLAERAALGSRGQPVLRLVPEILTQLGLATLPRDEPDEAKSFLKELAENEPPGWRRQWLAAIAKSRRRSVVSRGEVSWLVLEGDRLTAAELRALRDPGESNEDGVDLTTDDEDSFHAGVPVPLRAHSADVEGLAREFGSRVGLPAALVSDLALAGWLHDIGKADRRFQRMLRGGSEIELLKDETPWAKSGMGRSSREGYRLAQRTSGYPIGTRHEVQSLAMLDRHRTAVAERAHDLELVLHLVASHHGYCRPFAPAVEDRDPVDVALASHTSAAFGSLDFSAISSMNDLHRLDSGLADRFWSLVEKYGWLELCWLEAILRLADHRASEMEQERGSEP